MNTHITTKIFGFSGLFLGIIAMHALGMNGLIPAALFGAVGGGIGGAIGALVENAGKADYIAFLIDNLLWAILYSLPGLFIGIIVGESHGPEIAAICIIGFGLLTSVPLTIRKIKQKKKAQSSEISS